MDNHSLVTADRSTHAKIIGVAVAAAVAFASVGWYASAGSNGDQTARADFQNLVVKANKPSNFTQTPNSAIR